MRGAVGAALALLALAPITAEVLSGYLDVTGDLGASLFTWLFFIPLYSGMALLIREVSIRCGAGWPTRLMWGAAFGLAMTALIDLSLFTRERSEISFWSDIVEPTRIDVLGISLFPLATWVLGHVVLSTAAPIAIVEALAGPRLGARQWVAWPWLVVAAALFVGVALTIHIDEQKLWGASPSVVQVSTAAVACAALVVLGALTARRSRASAGAPTTADPRDSPGALRSGRRASRPWPSWAVLLLTGTAYGTVGSFPSWWGTVGALALIVIVFTALRRWSAHPTWSRRHLAAAAYGPVLATVLLSFSTPPAEGATSSGVVAQAGVLTVLTVLLGVALHRRTRAT